MTDDHPQKTDIKLKIRNVMADLLFTEVYNPGEPDAMLLFSQFSFKMREIK